MGSSTMGLSPLFEPIVEEPIVVTDDAGDEMRLGTKVTNPGEMRTRISLQSRTSPGDAGGFQVPAWITVASVWSRWTNAHGMEALNAQIAQVDTPATVLIRYLAGVDTTYAVLKGSLLYEIVSIDNIQERSEYLELKVVRMKAG